MEYKALSSWHAVLGGREGLNRLYFAHTHTRSKYEDSKECRVWGGEEGGLSSIKFWIHGPTLLYRSCQEEAKVYIYERTQKYEYDEGKFFLGMGSSFQEGGGGGGGGLLREGSGLN